MTERLDDHVAIERLRGAFEPIGLLEDDVGVEPADLPRRGRKLGGSDIEQPLLLPHHPGASELKHILARLELERAVAKGRFDDKDVGPGLSASRP